MAIHFLNTDGSFKSIEHRGAVLEVRKGVSVRIMSDVWGGADEALVWDKATKSPKLVTIRTCDYEWDTKSHAEVDATKAVKAAYRKYLIKQEYNDILGAEQARVNRIEKGCMVKVTRGRKVPKGTVGKVIVMLERMYGFGYMARPATKLGIATSDVMVDQIGKNGKVYKGHKDMVWVWAFNCDRTDVADIDEDEVMQMATEKIDDKLERNGMSL